MQTSQKWKELNLYFLPIYMQRTSGANHLGKLSNAAEYLGARVNNPKINLTNYVNALYLILFQDYC